MTPYKVEFRCNNCFLVFTKTFNKGTCAMTNEECPTCGIKDVSKTTRYVK